MESLVAWVIGIGLLFFAIVLLIGFIGIVFSGEDAPKVERRRTKSSLGSVFLAGLLLGMWMDDDE